MEDQRRLEYGKAVSDLERERAELRTLEDRWDETLAAFKAVINKSVQPQSAIWYNSFLSRLKESIEIQIGNVRKAEEEMDRRRAALAQAMKERKMLEILKEKQYAAYVRERNRAEQRSADELVSFRRGSREN
jgi:flagellar FliJ protein